MIRGKESVYFFYFKFNDIKVRVFNEGKGKNIIRVSENGEWKVLVEEIYEKYEENHEFLNNISEKLVYYLKNKSTERINILVNNGVAENG